MEPIQNLAVGRLHLRPGEDLVLDGSRDVADRLRPALDRHWPTDATSRWALFDNLGSARQVPAAIRIELRSEADSVLDLAPDRVASLLGELWGWGPAPLVSTLEIGQRSWSFVRSGLASRGALLGPGGDYRVVVPR